MGSFMRKSLPWRLSFTGAKPRVAILTLAMFHAPLEDVRVSLGGKGDFEAWPDLGATAAMRALSANSTVITRVFATTIDAIDIALPHFCARTVALAHFESRPLRRSTAGATNRRMKFQFSRRHLGPLTMLAAVTATFPAAAAGASTRTSAEIARRENGRGSGADGGFED